MEVIKIAKNEDIIRFFYEEHKRSTDIAEELKVSKPYITKIIQKDEIYIEEKEYRATKSKERHKVCNRNYINKKRQADKQEYQAMIIQINKDNEYLSTRKKISDIDFAKWNCGMYDYDKKNGDLVLKNGIVTGYNVCKRVKNVVNPSCIRTTV